MKFYIFYMYLKIRKDLRDLIMSSNFSLCFSFLFLNLLACSCLQFVVTSEDQLGRGERNSILDDYTLEYWLSRILIVNYLVF